MKTLYDVLGVDLQATSSQIERAYQSKIASLTGAGVDISESDAIQLKAVKEAFGVLSTPSRKALYDQRLVQKFQTESSGFPWKAIALVLVVAVGGAVYYKVQEQKAELEREALRAAAAKAEQEKAEKEAAAEQARLEQQRLENDRRVEAQQRFEVERARIEGQIIHLQNQAFEARAAREKAQAERQEALDQQREEIAARIRSQNEINAMQRALSIPIRRH